MIILMAVLIVIVLIVVRTVVVHRSAPWSTDSGPAVIRRAWT
jgi:hypothetical protein